MTAALAVLDHLSGAWLDALHAYALSGAAPLALAIAGGVYLLSVTRSAS
jgi:hypothetical protein